MAHSDAFKHVRRRPLMYVRSESFDSLAAYVMGYDAACEGGALLGFREWLYLRLDAPDNWAWTELVLRSAFPDAAPPFDMSAADADAHAHAVDTMFRLIEEFDEARMAPDGLRGIFSAYDRRRQAELAAD